MKKTTPSKKVVAGPYDTLTMPDKKRETRMVIEDVLGKFHVFPDKDAKLPSGFPEIAKRWDCLEDFARQNKNTILSYHTLFFNMEPPKKQVLYLTATWCWAYLVKESTPHLPETTIEGEPERKSSIAQRPYFRGESLDVEKWAESCTAGGITTAQARKCVEIFVGLIKGHDCVAEEDLKSKIIERGGELKTKQDPWRIFQYYRAKLIAAKLIRQG